jgi:leader peptidase (prepilin peptidase)/N-methyltransferase
MPDYFIYTFTFIFGLAIGSFINVCIYRIPRGISIIIPSSRCPECNTPIKMIDNIPILSFILLKGRCRICKKPIPIRYPLVEFLNAFLYTLILYRYGLQIHTLIYFILSSSLLLITFIDLDFQIIPDRITITGIPLGLIAGSFILPDPFLRYAPLGFKASIIGFLSGGILFLSIAIISKGGMGGGDIKLMSMIGSFMGWKSVLMTTFIGSLTGAIVGIFLMLFKGKGRKTKIPFGPFLSLGALITLLFGQEILYLYLNI